MNLLQRDGNAERRASRFEDQRYAKQQSGFPFSYFPSSEKKEKDRTACWTG
jgi:hypothetical protein